MNHHEEYFGAGMRRAIRQQLLENGVPAEFTGIIADVACNAAYEAVETIERMVWAHPDQRINVTALGIAISICKARLGHLAGAVSEKV